VAIDSVKQQTFNDWELLIVDDGDNPSAKKKLEFLFSEPWFTYLETKKNQGGAVARNVGIAAAKGKYIAFLDDDDIWVPEKLQIQYSAFEVAPNDVGFSFTGSAFGSLEGKIATVRDGVYNVHEQALTNFKGFLTITQMFKKSVLNEFGGFDETLPSHQDPELILRVSQKYKGLGINQPLSIVNIDEGRNNIGSNYSKRIKGREIILAKHKHLYTNHQDKYARLQFQLGLWLVENEEYKKACKVFYHSWQQDKKIRYLFHAVRSSLRSMLFNGKSETI